MSVIQHRRNIETLFSFEIFVEYIRINEHVKVSNDLAVGVRLLDFPTLIIYQRDPNGVQVQQPGHSVDDCGEGDPQRISPPPGNECAFQKGKSCLFKMDLDSLHGHLSHTPLHAMVLDVQDEIPKLFGTFSISLANVVGRIRLDVNFHGISTPSCGGERGLLDILDIKGNKIGFTFLRYKLSSLGVDQLPHSSKNKILQLNGAPVGERVQKDIEDTNMTEPLLRESYQMQSTKQDNQSNEKMLKLEAKQQATVSVATQVEPKPRPKVHQSLQAKDRILEEDVNVFCPPHLLYYSSDEKKSKNEAIDYSLSVQDLDSLLLEDMYSGDEASLSEIAGLRPPVTDPQVRHDVKTRSQKHQETNGMTSNVRGEALRQLPLLHALLIELSQLNGQRQNQPLSIHPDLAWIYQPTTEPSGFSTPCSGAASQRHDKSPKKEGAPLEKQPSSKSSKRKLVYGTTKTFQLRLQRASTGQVKGRDCLGAHVKTQTGWMTQDKTSNANERTVNHSKKKNNRSGLDDDVISTVMRNTAGDSGLQTVSKQEHQNEDVNKSQRRFEKDIDPKQLRETSSNSEAEMKLSHIVGVDDEDNTHNRDRTSHHSESYQNQPESDKNRRKTKAWGNSRVSSPKTTHSDSSRAEGEEGGYDDDFTSFEPSDGYSPELLHVYSPSPLSSPEPALAKTQKSSVCSDPYDSDSITEGVGKRVALPGAVKAHSSPQRSLMGTHIIRPRTRASALSISSDNDDLDVSTSIQTANSKGQTMDKIIAKSSPLAESLSSSKSKQSYSATRSAAVRGFSSDTISSFEPHEVTELEDELTSLDFKDQYQHISELVANKLPGYTM